MLNWQASSVSVGSLFSCIGPSSSVSKRACSPASQKTKAIHPSQQASGQQGEKHFQVPRMHCQESLAQETCACTLMLHVFDQWPWTEFPDDDRFRIYKVFKNISLQSSWDHQPATQISNINYETDSVFRSDYWAFSFEGVSTLSCGGPSPLLSCSQLRL